MARRKGSKNRTTLERELKESGAQGDLSKLSYDELATQAGAMPQPPPSIPEMEPPERSIIDPEQARVIIEDTRRRFDLMVDYYTTDEDVGMTGEDSFIPERIQEYLRLKAFMAGSVEEAREVARRALSKLHIHLLALWANKRISGPSTTENIQKRADKAEKWAVRLENLGRLDDARQQREKAEAIRRTVAVGSGVPWAV